MLIPSITVILSTYNGAEYLPAQLKSLSDQSVRPHQLVLRDDGSRDASVDIVTSWGKEHNIDIQIVRGCERLGPARSFMAALSAAAPADFYLFCDQDDVWLPDKIECALNSLRVFPEDMPHLYASRLYIVDTNLKKVGVSALPSHLSFCSAVCESVLTGCTMAFNQALKTIITRNKPNYLLMHDWWCYLVATSFGIVTYDSTPHILYRQHSHNVVGAGPSGLKSAQIKFKRYFGFGRKQRSRQLKEFNSLFSNQLNANQKIIVEKLTCRDQKLVHRLFIALSVPIQRQSLISQFFTRFSILTDHF